MRSWVIIQSGVVVDIVFGWQAQELSGSCQNLFTTIWCQRGRWDLWSFGVWGRNIHTNYCNHYYHYVALLINDLTATLIPTEKATSPDQHTDLKVLLLPNPKNIYSTGWSSNDIMSYSTSNERACVIFVGRRRTSHQTPPVPIIIIRSWGWRSAAATTVIVNNFSFKILTPVNKRQVPKMLLQVVLQQQQQSIDRYITL